MKYKITGVFILVWLVFSSVAMAQKIAEKPYQKWSKDDALKILSDSSWAKSYQSTNGQAGASALQAAREQTQTANSGGSNPRSVERNFGPPPVYLRLHSALPVRQAIVRLQMLANNYDKLDEQKKADFDNSSKAYLACAICQNYYVVTLTQAPNSSGSSVEEGIFQRMTLEDMKGNIFLENDKGERRELVQFTPPKGRGDSAVFFFARKDDKGNLLIGPESKELKFGFKNEFLKNTNPYAYLVPRSFEFKVSKMMIGENIEF